MARVALITLLRRARLRLPRPRAVHLGSRDGDWDVARGPRARGCARGRDGHQQRDRCARSTPDRRHPARPHDLQHPGVVVPALPDGGRPRDAGRADACSPRSTRSTREWSGCWPARVRSTRSGAGTGVSGETSTDPDVGAALDVQIRAAAAVAALAGSTFGRIGGRPMGMYTAVAHSDTWLEKFGVDVEEIDQWEIVRRSETIDSGRVSNARRWLEQHAAGVHYDGAQLTPEATRTTDPLLLRDARVD